MQDGLMSSSSRAARTRSCGLALQASESPTSHREIEDGPRKAKKARSDRCSLPTLRCSEVAGSSVSPPPDKSVSRPGAGGGGALKGGRLRSFEG